MTFKSISYNLRLAYQALSDKPTQAMVDFFEKRTKEHIDRVNANIKEIFKKYPQYSNYKYDHDKSKYSPEERLPYIWLTEFYRTKKKLKYPEGMKEKIETAVQHHYKSNSHHVEYYDGDASKMTDKDLLEMCADWLAMGQEKGTSTKDWADKVLPTKNFTPEQKDLIYKFISVIE